MSDSDTLASINLEYFRYMTLHSFIFQTSLISNIFRTYAVFTGFFCEPHSKLKNLSKTYQISIFMHVFQALFFHAHHLNLFRICSDGDLDYCLVYEFVFDRLRAVRQDLVIQSITDGTTVYILEQCIQFYLTSSARLVCQFCIFFKILWVYILYTCASTGWLVCLAWTR